MGDPLLLRSDMTGRVYVVTAYKVIEPGETGHDVIEATKKYDVTSQFDKIVEAICTPVPNPWHDGLDQGREGDRGK
jgi:hypothetical protein